MPNKCSRSWLCPCLSWSSYHRIPSIFTCCLSIAAYTLVWIVITSCEFVDVIYKHRQASSEAGGGDGGSRSDISDLPNYTQYNAINIEDRTSTSQFAQSHSVGIFCPYNDGSIIDNDNSNAKGSLWTVSQVFSSITLFITTLSVILTCLISTIVPPNDLNWRVTGYLSTCVLVASVPVFWMLDSDALSCAAGDTAVQCYLGDNAIQWIIQMCLHVIIASITITLQPPNQWANESDVWKRRRNKFQRHIRKRTQRTLRRGSLSIEDIEQLYSPNNNNNNQAENESCDEDEVDDNDVEQYRVDNIEDVENETGNHGPSRIPALRRDSSMSLSVPGDTFGYRLKHFFVELLDIPYLQDSWFFDATTTPPYSRHDSNRNRRAGLVKGKRSRLYGDGGSDEDDDNESRGLSLMEDDEWIEQPDDSGRDFGSSDDTTNNNKNKKQEAAQSSRPVFSKEAMDRNGSTAAQFDPKLNMIIGGATNEEGSINDSDSMELSISTTTTFSMGEAARILGIRNSNNARAVVSAEHGGSNSSSSSISSAHPHMQRKNPVTNHHRTRKAPNGNKKHQNSFVPPSLLGQWNERKGEPAALSTSNHGIKEEEDDEENLFVDFNAQFFNTSNTASRTNDGTEKQHLLTHQSAALSKQQHYAKMKHNSKRKQKSNSGLNGSDEEQHQETTYEPPPSFKINLDDIVASDDNKETDANDAAIYKGKTKHSFTLTPRSRDRTRHLLSIRSFSINETTKQQSGEASAVPSSKASDSESSTSRFVPSSTSSNDADDEGSTRAQRVLETLLSLPDVYRDTTTSTTTNVDDDEIEASPQLDPSKREEESVHNEYINENNDDPQCVDKDDLSAALSRVSSIAEEEDVNDREEVNGNGEDQGVVSSSGVSIEDPFEDDRADVNTSMNSTSPYRISGNRLIVVADTSLDDSSTSSSSPVMTLMKQLQTSNRSSGKDSKKNGDITESILLDVPCINIDGDKSSTSAHEMSAVDNSSIQEVSIVPSSISVDTNANGTVVSESLCTTNKDTNDDKVQASSTNVLSLSEPVSESLISQNVSELDSDQAPKRIKDEATATTMCDREAKESATPQSESNISTNVQIFKRLLVVETEDDLVVSSEGLSNAEVSSSVAVVTPLAEDDNGAFFSSANEDNDVQAHLNCRTEVSEIKSTTSSLNEKEENVQSDSGITVPISTSNEQKSNRSDQHGVASLISPEKEEPSKQPSSYAPSKDESSRSIIPPPVDSCSSSLIKSPSRTVLEQIDTTTTTSAYDNTPSSVVIPVTPDSKSRALSKLSSLPPRPPRSADRVMVKGRHGKQFWEQKFKKDSNNIQELADDEVEI